MLPVERVPAVRRIETDRKDAFAVEIAGEFNAGDAENLYGLLEGAYALSARIDLIVRLTELESVDLSSLSPATAESMRDEASRHVTRCAVIGDGGWASRVSRLFEPASGVELRHYTAEDEALAWEWIGARAIG